MGKDKCIRRGRSDTCLILNFNDDAVVDMYNLIILIFPLLTPLTIYLIRKNLKIP